MTTFDELVHGLFADLFRASPVLATWLGNHDHDGSGPTRPRPARGRWSRSSIGGRAAFTALPGRLP